MGTMNAYRHTPECDAASKTYKAARKIMLAVKADDRLIPSYKDIVNRAYGTMAAYQKEWDRCRKENAVFTTKNSSATAPVKRAGKTDTVYAGEGL